MPARAHAIAPTRSGRLRRSALRTATVAVAVLTAACGARLSPAEHAVYDRAYSGDPVGGTAGPLPVQNAAPAGPVDLPTVVATAPSATGAAPSRVITAAPPTGGRVPSAPTASRARAPAAPASATAPSAVMVDPRVCASTASGPGLSPSEIDLGTVTTLTGPVPGVFLGAVHGVQAFATYLNSRGGICGRKVVVKSGDDNLQISQNAAATQSLSGQVFAFVGSFSADDAGMAQAIGNGHVPDIGQALSKQRFDMTNNFSPEPIAGWNAAPFLLFKQRFPEATQHMAILAVNQPVDRNAYDAEKAALESIGYKFIYTNPNIEPTQTDFSSDAQAMKAAGVQGVIDSSTAQLIADLARAMANAGLTVQLPTYATTAYDQAFLQGAGNAAEGTILEVQEAMFQGEDAQVVPMVGVFNQWYQALYHAVPDLYAVYGWMSGLLFLQGLNHGGALTQPALLSGLRGTTHFDAGGLVAPNDPAHKKPPDCYLIIEVTGGKFVRDTSNPTGFNCQYTPHYYSTGR